jgi:PAS domain S-box-containing protein
MKMREQLDHATAILSAQLESSIDGILVVDSHERIVCFNSRFADLWRLPSEVLDSGADGKAIAFVLDQLSDPRGFLARVREYYKHRWMRGRDEVALRDGRVFERYTAPIHGPRGRYKGRIWHFRDVTAARENAAERRQVEAKYRQLFEAATDPVFVLDACTRRIEDANRAALARFGYAKPELLRLRGEDLDADKRDARSALRIYWLRRRWPARITRPLRTKHGEDFPAEIGGGAFLHNGRVKLIGMVRDTTLRERAAETERLRERERLQRELVATVSHELRTPIAAIRGFAETLAAGAHDDPKTRAEFVHTILRQSERVSRLIDDLLTLSVLETGRRKASLESVDAARLTADIVAAMRPVAKKRRLKISADVRGSLRLRADAGQLTQALQNLLDNAVKFSPAGSKISLAAARKGAKTVLTVTDEGPGVPKEELARIFEPFHRCAATRALPGAGLGLAIVRQVAAVHGGRAWAENRPAKGAAFHLELPADAA